MDMSESTLSPKADMILLPIRATDIWVSDEVCHILQWIVIGVTCQLVSIVGIATNVINIICFIKQGFKDSVNINLLGLSFSDLGCLTTLTFSNLCYTPAFQESDLPFNSQEIQYLISAWPHVIFSRITGWITALITLERCLCITMPLKVKRILTPCRVASIIVAVFLVNIVLASPVYYVNSYGWKYFPQINKTVMGLISLPEREVVEKYTFALNNLITPGITFAVVIICTTLLVIKLKNKMQRRVTLTGTKQAQATSNRDHKIAKMVVAVSSLFLLCYFPVCVVFIAMIFLPGLTVDGENKNAAFVIGSFGVFLESTNSAFNICIYYSMSSKFRHTFRHFFRFCSRGCGGFRKWGKIMQKDNICH